MENLLYVIQEKKKKEDIIEQLKAHPEIKFVSLVGVDMAGNDTDEKIPVRIFIKDISCTTNAMDAVMRAIGQRGYLADWTNDDPMQDAWR